MSSFYLRGMSQHIVITPARLEDAPAIVQLVNSAYRGDSSRKGWTTEADLLDGIRVDMEGIQGLLANNQTTILKANATNGELVGVVQLQQQETSMYLGMLTVNPMLQNTGIGKQLMAAGEQWALEKGCTKMVMTVISVRDELIRWYKGKGYNLTGDRKPFPQDPRFGIPKQPLEFIVMEKPLSPQHSL